MPRKVQRKGEESPFLTLKGAVFDKDRRLDHQAYLVLKDQFPEEKKNAKKAKQKLAPGDWPGFRPEDGAAPPRGLKVWSNAKGCGWIAERKGKGSRWFGVSTWGSWRLAFLLAKLQLEVWDAADQPPAAGKKRKAQAETPCQEAQQPSPVAKKARAAPQQGKKRRANDSVGDLPAPRGRAAPPQQAQGPAIQQPFVSNSTTSGLTPAALAVLGQFEPMFSRWLLCTDGIEVGPGINPSPFDLHAMACTGRALAHLVGRSFEANSKTGEPERPTEKEAQGVRRRRVWKKSPDSAAFYQPPPPAPTPEQMARTAMSNSKRLAETISAAVRSGDLDATRHRLEVLGDSPVIALRAAIRHSQAEIVRYLVAKYPAVVSAGKKPKMPSEPPGSPGRKSTGLRDPSPPRPREFFVGDAITVLMRNRNVKGPEMEVLEALVRGGAELDAAIWPALPALGSTFSSAEWDRRAQTPRGRNEEKPVSALAVLPFIQRGDGPLAWAVRAHSAAKQDISQLLRVIMRLLLENGADQEKLSRRQLQTLKELMDKNQDPSGCRVSSPMSRSRNR